ncbi:hypothetical protein PRK78_000033 [Emydomyces testavorans]|uniref:HIT domain-containing protein n=1 Tax=Emydomyces testavorans TaxID=2070801 RepID=A0AAF0IFL2_9EURO|nr:hypothetical protein PRK78_000033 [Emydomyces testavorans]
MLCLSPTAFPIIPSHQFYSDNDLVIGLSRYPTTPGHTVVILNQHADLFSLPVDKFVSILGKVSKAASALCQFYYVKRCALVTEGGRSLFILPLHGLSEDWKPVTSDVVEFHETFPGYISSRNGPMLSPEKLGDICAKIQAVSGLSKPFNYRFDGAADDANLFARIVRGELQQWRVWEDEHHVAFLTPFANTPGFTVLVPREHLSSDIFSIKGESFSRLMTAARTVGTILKRAFEIAQCGMIFEGFEIDYAHVKLIPIQQTGLANGDLTDDSSIVEVAPFHKTYQGYVSSLGGPLFTDFAFLTSAARDIHKRLPTDLVHISRSCASSERRLSSVLSEPLDESVFLLQDFLFHTSVMFLQKNLGYKFCFVPATSDAISSPMDLGFGSKLVPFSFPGQQIRPADSIQFSLEYYLRTKDDLPGVYYFNTSFHGEAPDAMHLDPFYHMECGLRGPLSLGISIAERYITTLISTLLSRHKNQVEKITGKVDHLAALLEYYHSHGDKFPQITVTDALTLSTMDNTCWKNVAPEHNRKQRTLTRAGELKLIEHFGGAVWLTERDHLIVPFYHAFADGSHAKARCADLLFGTGEVVRMSGRHVSREDVRAALEEHELPAESYAWYMEIRDSAAILTTGWSMDMEHFLAWVFRTR